MDVLTIANTPCDEDGAWHWISWKESVHTAVTAAIEGGEVPTETTLATSTGMNSRWHGVPGSSPSSIAFDFDKVAGLSSSDDQDTDMSSTRSSSLSDVPEHSTPPSSSLSPYLHPGHPATGSASTFAAPPSRNGSAPPIPSHSHVAGPSTHRPPATLRRSSSRSLHRTLTESNTPSLAPGASTASSTVAQTLRRNGSNGSTSSLSAVTTLGARGPRVQPTPPSAASSPSPREGLPRRTNPRLPHDKDAAPAPPTAMYWSKAPVYGTMLNRPVRSHSVTLLDTTAWVLGGCDDHDSSTDIFCFDIETMQWTHPGTQGDPPPPCRAHTCTLFDRKMFIIGGGLGPTYYDFIYVLDTTTRFWHRPTVAKESNVPHPASRRAHTAVLHHGVIWVFGGGNGMQALNDLWTLDVSAYLGYNGKDAKPVYWQKVETKGEPPAPRGYHTANLIGNFMIVTGGSDGFNYFTDLWLLNLENLEWKPLKMVEQPHKLLAHTSTQVGSYLYIIGGHNGERYTSDVLLFNLVNLQYEKRVVYGKPPNPRGYHATILADSRLFLFGGYDGVTSYDDVHILDLAANAYLPQVTSFTIDAP
ncbi:hypothetical protein APHAL10511_007531 [Amanita phalloides]|nr:hypothetical protein APHAL10511_007531 [Amanita phalloides]